MPQVNKKFRKGYQSFSFRPMTVNEMVTAVQDFVDKTETEREPGNWAVLFQMRRVGVKFTIEGSVVTRKSMGAFDEFIKEAKHLENEK